MMLNNSQLPPVTIEPPPVSGDEAATTLQIIYWVLGIIIAVGSPLLSAWWAWRKNKSEKEIEQLSKAREDEAKKLAEERKERAERMQAERDQMAEFYKREAEQQANFYTTLMDEVKALRSENQELRVQVSKLGDEIKHLEGRIEYYERNPANSYARRLLAAVFNSMPCPAWVRDVANNSWYLNDAYCEKFNVKRVNFWTPVNIFGRYKPEDAAMYSANDLHVIKANTSIEFEEKVRVDVMDPECDQFLVASFRKSPIIVDEQPFVFGQMLDPCPKE